MLSVFSSIYGIGPHSAQRLYNLGLCSLDDLEIYYGVEREEIKNHGEIFEQEGKRMKLSHEKGELGDDDVGDSRVRIALGLREDLMKK